MKKGKPMPQTEEYKQKTTLRLENDMAEQLMDSQDVDDVVTLMVKGKVVSKSVDSYDGKQRPCMSIEVSSVIVKEKNDIEDKLSKLKSRQQK